MVRVRHSSLIGSALFLVAGLTPAFVTTAAAQTGTAQSAAAQEEARRLREELDRLRKEFEARVGQLEARISQLTGAGQAQQPAPQPTPPPQPAQTPPPAPPPSQVPLGAGKAFNPDISVNGNFVAAAGRNPFTELSPMQLSEVEAAFQAIVDPYARADFFLAAGSEGVEVEEGYITFTSLPANLLLKVGKLRAQFGKMNTLHTHSVPTADRPLMTANLVGGDEGLSDAGVSLAHIVRLPHVYLELTGEVFAGLSEVFQSDQRSKLAYVGRVRAYSDITESSNIDLGVSFATGPTRVEVQPALLDGVEFDGPTLSAVGLKRTLIGFDATFRYRPLQRAIYRRLNLRTEMVWNRQTMPNDAREHGFGMYALGEYQFARRWYIGARADRAARALDASAIDKGGSAFLTFWPTEFSQIRGQFRHIRFAEGVRGNEFLFQFNFSIGAHGVHVF